MRILYLDLDTLRHDHLGCYGYPRRTSPNIDRIAAQGITFDKVYCADAPCLPSRTGLMTGRFGIHTGVVGHSGTNADPRIDGPRRGFRDSLSTSSLPAMLKKAGLHTVFIGGFGERHSSWSFYAGFREIHDTGKGGMESAEDVSPTVLEWIESNARKDNWYLHVNYWDPHTPYRAPTDFGNPFTSEDRHPQEIPAWITDEILHTHRQLPGPHTAQDINMYDNRTDPRYPRHPGELKDMQDLKRLIDGYDTGIAYMDSHIGKLFAALEREGVMDDLVIIISADHAENMGELGIYAEHGTADEATCHIPLIIRWPGKARGMRDRGLHYQLDLGPTLAEMLGVEAPANWEGQSYAKTIQQGKEAGREFLVISQCAHVCQRSVRWGPWLYMRTYHDGFHLFPDEMLFNLDEDPHEEHNLAERHPEVCIEAASRLLGWHDAMMKSMPPGYTEDPMYRVLAEGGPTHARGALKNYCQRLTATGRGAHVEALKQRHPQEFQ
jgi:choline-sulfatase